mmetsp:Transcript_35545/g.96362  ORF Transcript_35545/g.96362 Transcript_35545/m.96362 type:complete len:314 (-) Transcript_35545:7-948(-)
MPPARRWAATGTLATSCAERTGGIRTRACKRSEDRPPVSPRVDASDTKSDAFRSRRKHSTTEARTTSQSSSNSSTANMSAVQVRLRSLGRGCPRECDHPGHCTAMETESKPYLSAFSTVSRSSRSSREANHWSDHRWRTDSRARSTSARAEQGARRRASQHCLTASSTSSLPALSSQAARQSPSQCRLPATSMSSSLSRGSSAAASRTDRLSLMAWHMLSRSVHSLLSEPSTLRKASPRTCSRKPQSKKRPAELEHMPSQHCLAVSTNCSVSVPRGSWSQVCLKASRTAPLAHGLGSQGATIFISPALSSPKP